MRKPRLAVGVSTMLAILMFAVCGCAPAENLPPGYLDAYEPLLKSWTLKDKEAWVSFPRYEINVTLDTDALTLAGTETVQFTNRTGLALQRICFRLYPNVLRSGSPLSVSHVTTNGMRVEFLVTNADTVLEIHCDPPVEPDQIVELDITFSLGIPDDASGWVLLGRSQNIISLPDFYPILAVHDDSGWRREIPPAFADAGFADAAFYRVNLTTDADQVIVSTGSIVSQALQADGLMQTEIIAGPIREFVILASPDYEVASIETCGTVVDSYYLKGDRAAGLTALHRAASALQVYSDMYGSYPFTTMHVAEAPLQFKGMEFSTLNLLGVDLYRAHRSQLSYLTIHEVAHQWWYSQVGSDPFKSPWLDEGLAEYSAYVYYWKTYGRAEADALRDRRWIAALEYARSTDSDTVLAEPVTEYSSPKVYESMVYAKGALFFDALRRAVGDDVYYTILREYVRRYRFRNALPEHFFAIAREVSGRDLTPLINEWILSAE